MKTVLVTGGNGFIGRYVVEELLSRGYEPAVLDTRFREPVEGATLVLGDIRDAVSVTEAVAHADGVIHLAGVLGTQETITNPRPAAESNILGGLNVLEACAQYDVPLVNIAVGNWWMANTYAISKNSVERFCEMFRKERKTRVSVVRAMNAYGPRQSAVPPYGSSKVRKIMPSLICRALSDEPLEIYGDGEQVMDMIYVADVASVLVKTLETTNEIGAIATTVEAGSGRETTVNQITAIVAAEVEKIVKHPIEIVHVPMRPGEHERAIVLGKPETLSAIGMDAADFVSLEEGVPQTVDYFRRMLNE